MTELAAVAQRVPGLIVTPLAMTHVYVNDLAMPTWALAVSERANRAGERDSFLLLTLSLKEEGWFVTDIDFESEESADRDLKKFLEANPKSISVPPQREAQARAARANSLVGHWKVVKLADMPVDQLAGATVVIDLADADDVKGESNVRAKYSLKGNTLCLALNAKKGDHPRPESATGEAPQDGMLYIVLELDETAKSSEAAKASDVLPDLESVATANTLMTQSGTKKTPASVLQR